jgi:HK97 gp10 family phage protein
MTTNLKLEGIDAILSHLNSLGTKADVLEKKALQAAAKPVAETMKQKVNLSDKDHKHIREDIRITIKTKDGIPFAQIGPSKTTTWRAKFLEFGTQKMSAHPFIEPSLHENKTRVRSIIHSELKRGLHLD